MDKLGKEPNANTVKEIQTGALAAAAATLNALKGVESGMDECYMQKLKARAGARARGPRGSRAMEAAPATTPVPAPHSSEKSWPAWSPQPMAPVVRRYVNWPGNGTQLPFSGHNHEPTIATCSGKAVLSCPWQS